MVSRLDYLLSYAAESADASCIVSRKRKATFTPVNDTEFLRMRERMIKQFYYDLLRRIFRLLAWLRYNRKYHAFVTPDQVIDVNPRDISEKSRIKPRVSRLTFTSVLGGDWDLAVEDIEDDIVYRSFVSRFIHRAAWRDTPYFDFLRSSRSEHGGKTDQEIDRRCQQLDQLFRYIHRHGFKRQEELETASDIVFESWKHGLIPPEFREISINIARDGRLLWNGGFHRLCIARILELDQIPVRITVRHAQWQKFRDALARDQGIPGRFRDHPDIVGMRCRR